MWANGYRNGQGTNYFMTGEMYDGQWVNDMREGMGTNYYPDGSVVFGMWSQDKYVTNNNAS
jgi:antitoxin component YwqK of YwqJK toxin-antitoxin module